MMFTNVPRFVFFTGKGGVGKTSLACATALGLADQGKRVLLVSTDPASNVGQVFETEIGNRITAIPDVHGLEAIEINPEEAAAEYRERLIRPMREVLPREVLAGMEEQLSGACTTEIAAFDEFTELLTDDVLIGRYDHIVFDTAPTGHTIRLLKLPGAWSGFIETAKGESSCLGPLAGLEKQRDRYKAAVAALGNETQTLMVLVARPSGSALDEAARTARQFDEIGIRNRHLAINGMMPPEAGADPLARALRERERTALDAIDPALANLPQSSFALQPYNLVGVAALRAFTGSPDQVKAVSDVAKPPAEKRAWPTLATLVDDLEGPGKGLIMLMGKGGVGKTTIAAAIAVELAARGHDVHLTTTDPAAHLHQTLNGEFPRLTVDRIDPVVETERYRAHVLESKGRDLDAEARALLEEDLRSPCTEEIAVFQAFSRVIRESGQKFVVIDTAPTGHSLLLLDATGAYHREIMRHASDGGGKVVTPMMRLRDGERTRIIIVTLPETTPVLEAKGLQEELRRAGIEPWGWVVNTSLAAARTDNPLLSARAGAEVAQIDRVERELARRFGVVPMSEVEPVGVKRLRAIVRSLDTSSGVADRAELAGSAASGF